MKLRDYQLSAVDSVFKEWETVNSVLGCAPTGSGKTTIFCEIIRRSLPKRALILAHRDELVGQIVRRLADAGIDSEIEKAELVASTSLFNSSPVVVATPQTLYSSGGKRLSRWRPDDFGVLIVDELHHYVSPSFRKCIDYFRQNPNLKMCGVTATADRHDGKALSLICQSVAFNIEIVSLIKQGYLVDVDQRMVRIASLDLSQCGEQTGDFSGRDLADVMEFEKNLLGVADATWQLLSEKRTLVFCASVKQSERLAEIFNRYRPGVAAMVCGETPQEERRTTLRKFESGEIQIVVNCAVLTEGYDNPAIEAVVMARPTKSRSLYAQMLGRGTRPLPGVVHDGHTGPEQRCAAIAASKKPMMIVLDFVGNAGRHLLISSADLLAGSTVSEEAKKLARKRIEEKGDGRMLEELEKAERDIKEAIEAQKRKGIRGTAKYQETFVDPFDVFSRRAEKWKSTKQTWPLTPKQRTILLNKGYDPDKLTPEEGGKIIEKLWTLTDKQKRVLLRAGYSDTELDGIRNWEASTMIDNVIKNGWKRPNKPMGEPVETLPQSDTNGFAD